MNEFKVGDILEGEAGVCTFKKLEVVAVLDDGKYITKIIEKHASRHHRLLVGDYFRLNGTWDYKKRSDFFSIGKTYGFVWGSSTRYEIQDLLQTVNGDPQALALMNRGMKSEAYVVLGQDEFNGMEVKC